MSRVFHGKVIFYVFLLLVLDLCAVSYLRVGNVRFVLSYLIVVYAAFQWGWRTALPIAILVGLGRDCLQLSSFGVETTSLIVGALVLDLLVQKMEREWLIMKIFGAFVFIFVTLVTQIILLRILFDYPTGLWRAVALVFWVSVYSTLWVPAFFVLSKKWFRDAAALKQYELFK